MSPCGKTASGFMLVCVCFLFALSIFRLMAVEDELRVGVVPDIKSRILTDQVCFAACVRVDRVSQNIVGLFSLGLRVWWSLPQNKGGFVACTFSDILRNDISGKNYKLGKIESVGNDDNSIRMSGLRLSYQRTHIHTHSSTLLMTVAYICFYFETARCWSFTK